MRLLLQNLWWRLGEWMRRPRELFMEAAWLERFKKEK